MHSTATMIQVAREGHELRTFFVHGEDSDGVTVDPTAFPVEVAFARDCDRPADWHPATWIADEVSSPVGAAYRAELDVGGPGTGADVELAPGRWVWWVRVTTPTEVPVIQAGLLSIL